MTNLDKSYLLSTFYTISFGNKCGYSGQYLKSISLNYISDNIRDTKKDWLIRINLDTMSIRRNINHPLYQNLKEKIDKFIADISFYFQPFLGNSAICVIPHFLFLDLPEHFNVIILIVVGYVRPFRYFILPILMRAFVVKYLYARPLADESNVDVFILVCLYFQPPSVFDLINITHLYIFVDCNINVLVGHYV